MSSANRQYMLNDKNQIVPVDENGVPQTDVPVDNTATIHLQTPPPQQADQSNVYFANAGKNNAYNSAGVAFFSDKQPTYETYEAYLKAQSSANAAAHHHAQQQQQQAAAAAAARHHHAHAAAPVAHAHATTPHHAAAHHVAHAPPPAHVTHVAPPAHAAPQPSKGGCTACKDCNNKVLPATITFVNHVPDTPIYPESQVKEADSNIVKQYYYAQPPVIHSTTPPAPAVHQPTPQPQAQTPHHHQQTPHHHQQTPHHHQQTPHHQQHTPHHQQQTPHHHQQTPPVTKVIKTKQIATVAPPPPQAAAPVHHAPVAAVAAHAHPQQVYYHPIPHPPAHKQHHVPAAPAVHQAPAPKPCTACKQQQQQPQVVAPVQQPKQPVYYAHHKPAPYYSTLPTSVSKQPHPLAHYVPAPIVAPAHIQAQHPPVQHPTKQQIIRQKSSGNLLRHQPIAPPSVDKVPHHHYQQPTHHHHHHKPADPSPAPKSNCTSCKQSAQPPSRASGSLNRAETVGCLPCMQKKLQMEAQIKAQIEAQEAADLQAKIRALQSGTNHVRVAAAQKA